MNQFEIGEGGRVKMAGGSMDIYYQAAGPLLAQGSDGALEAHNNFMELRDSPPPELSAAYFPSVGPELKQRLRGAGLYRYLRMDQGPGGNFTAFTVNDFGDQQTYSLAEPIPHALLEESVRGQIAHLPGLGALALSVTAAYAKRNLGKTYGLMKQFSQMAEDSGVVLPSAAVGSRSGFFLINPVETNQAKLSADSEPAVGQALTKVRAFAHAARKNILAGMTFQDAVALAKQNPQTPESDPDDLLYFQPDCFVDTNGNVAVEKINFPDVGFFLTEIENAGNKPLLQVVEIVKKLQSQVVAALDESLKSTHVTLVVKDESVAASTDLLEVNEARALKKMLESSGFAVEVLGISDCAKIRNDSSALVLNPDIESEAFASFTERIVHENIPAYPDPLLKVFEHEATTLSTTILEGRYLEKFLTLIRPKKIDGNNAGKLSAELSKVLSLGGISEDVDIMYAFVPGKKMPVPLFRHSFHSFMQLHNAIEKNKRESKDVSSVILRAVPFANETAVFGDDKGKRLAAFRPMYIRKNL